MCLIRLDNKGMKVDTVLLFSIRVLLAAPIELSVSRRISKILSPGKWIEIS